MNYPPAENLNEWFPGGTSHDMDSRLGVVVGGSLSKGLVVKLDREQTVEDRKAHAHPVAILRVFIHGLVDVENVGVVDVAVQAERRPAIRRRRDRRLRLELAEVNS